jgi:hypothetical protein
MSKINKKIIIAFLFMLSVVLTTGSFAYWATSIANTESIASSQLQIGSAKGVETIVSVSSSSQTSNGRLVPTTQIENSIGLVTDQIDFLYELTWFEQQEITQVSGEDIYGLIQSVMTIQIIPNDQQDPLDYVAHQEIYNLIQITFHEDNPTMLRLNDNQEQLYRFSVSMEEPTNQLSYQLISNSTIYINTEFIIETNIFDLDYDFEPMSQDDFLRSGAVSYDLGQWFTTEGESLQTLNNTQEKFVFFPITKDEYTLTVEATLHNISSISGGYGILFDTYFGDEGFRKDNGYILQFDRGYADGELIIRPRVNGYEQNAYWREASHHHNHFPTKYEDPSWWVTMHELQIVVSNSDADTRIAEIYLDGIMIGSATYPDIITNQQQYVGLRVWGGSDVDFYTLKVE